MSSKKKNKYPKKDKNGVIIFKDYPEFTSNLTPEEVIKLGSFGGTYFRPIYSSVTNKHYKNQENEFPFFKGISKNKLTSVECDKNIDKYKVKSGTSLDYWEDKGWMRKQDPYGWFQWYCRFYSGRRSEDDERQIDRWLKFTGPKGRFKRRLINMINKKKTTYDDYSISPVIRQGLQHWAYQLTRKDIK